MDELSAAASAFGDVSQARAVVRLLRDHLLPAYRAFHRDLLWHQPDRELVAAAVPRPGLRGHSVAGRTVERNRTHRRRRSGIAQRLPRLSARRRARIRAADGTVRPRTRAADSAVHPRCRRRPRHLRGADRAGAGDPRARPTRISCSRPGSIRSWSRSWRSIRGRTTSITRPASGPTTTSASGICTTSITAATIAASCCSRSRSTRCCRAIDSPNNGTCAARRLPPLRRAMSCCSKRPPCWPARS